jgi:hypothetical protein
LNLCAEGKLMRLLQNNLALTSVQAVCMAMALTLSAIAAEHTFDDADSAEQFVRTGIEAKFTHDASAGIAGGGGLVPGPTGFAGQWVERVPITGEDQACQVSVAFKHQANDNVTGQGLFIGVGPDFDYVPTLSPSHDAADHHLLVAMQGSGDETSAYRLLIQAKTAGEVSNQRGQIFRLLPGRWYRLSMSVSPSSAGVVVQAAVHLLDDKGQAGASVAALERDALPLPRPSATASGLHAFFGGQAMTPQRGFAAIDNFMSTARSGAP